MTHSMRNGLRPLRELPLQVEQIDSLDKAAAALAKAVERAAPAGSSVNETLSGTDFGHPIHPPFTDVVIGAWTGAVALDWLGGKRGGPAADWLGADPRLGDPTVVICMDEFGPLNLRPHPGKQWAPAAIGTGDPTRPRRRRRRATYNRPNGIRHLLAGYDLATDRLYGHIKLRKDRTQFLAFCRYLRSLHPPQVRIAIVLDNSSPHRSTKTDRRVGAWAAANNVELAYTPFYGSWLNRIEAQFTALRHFTLDGTDHDSHRAQARMIRRYIAWRNRHATDPKLRKVIRRAETIKRTKVA